MAEASETLVHPTPGRAAPQRVFRVQPARRWLSPNLRELWGYRELLFFLVWRDVKVRYKQTFLGAGWALLQPFATMIVFAYVFGQWIGVPSQHVPYPLFVVAGLLPWTYFSSSLMLSSQSVVANSALVSKVYFPRLIIPMSAVMVPVVDFLVAFGLLISMFLYYGMLPHWHASVSFVFLGMALTTALGAGLWLSALNVRYRDVPYIVPFLTQIWLYASPVIYPVSIVPKSVRWVLGINPMTGVIDGFRWTVFGKGLPEYPVYATSAGVAILLLVTGLVYFRRVERRFADLV